MGWIIESKRTRGANVEKRCTPNRPSSRQMGLFGKCTDWFEFAHVLVPCIGLALHPEMVTNSKYIANTLVLRNKGKERQKKGVNPTRKTFPSDISSFLSLPRARQQTPFSRTVMPLSSDLIDNRKKSQTQKTRKHSDQDPGRRLHTPPRTDDTPQWITLPTTRRTLRIFATPRQHLASGTSRRRSHDCARRSIRLRLRIIIQTRRRER